MACPESKISREAWHMIKVKGLGFNKFKTVFHKQGRLCIPLIFWQFAFLYYSVAKHSPYIDLNRNAILKFIAANLS